MSGSLLSLRQRLTRVEGILIELQNRLGPRDPGCDCRALTIADSSKPEKFEKEMNRMCRVHSVRRLGTIVEIKHIGPATAESAKLDQLLKIYRARTSPAEFHRATLREAYRKLGFEYGSKES
jgi:hypothetical protein